MMIGPEQLNRLRVHFAIGAGAVGNPLGFLQQTPGASISGRNTIMVNGAPAGTLKILLRARTLTSALDARVSDALQASAEANRGVHAALQPPTGATSDRARIYQ
jgi:hypothetical protein